MGDEARLLLKSGLRVGRPPRVGDEGCLRLKSRAPVGGLGFLDIEVEAPSGGPGFGFSLSKPL